jgi:hypothetical protein
MVRSDRFRLCIRIPRWAEKITIKVNGVETIPPVLAGWATIERLWENGDGITVQIPMQVRFDPVDRQHPNRVAIVYGPVVLVQDGQYTLPFSRKAFHSGARGAIVPTENPLEFQITVPPPKGVFAPSWGLFGPFYRVSREVPYRMYFDLDGHSDIGVSRP